MIVVIGSPVFGGEDQLPGHRAGGLAARIALAIAAARSSVELAGKIGDDAAGDMIAVDLEHAGVGHAALLRDPSVATPETPRPGLALDRADVELALQYLPEARVFVTADPLAAPVLDAVAAAARYAGAHRIVVESDSPVAGAGGAGGAVTPPDGDAETGAESAADPRADRDVTVLQAPKHDEGAFAGFVGRYAAYLEAGRKPSDAFAAAADEVGWEPARSR